MIHREGYRIILVAAILLAALNAVFAVIPGPGLFLYIFNAASVLFLIFVLRFFRNPRREALTEGNIVYAPADGKVVAVEETHEPEYFQDRRTKVSIFMSVWDVHVNWYPVSGTVELVQYHPGKYLVAWHPKSSILNERNTCVLRTGAGSEILVRQIAGTLARRIISYARVRDKVVLGDELGFIRFGSRVDIFLPPGTRILVRPGQKTRGLLTPVADL